MTKRFDSILNDMANAAAKKINPPTPKDTPKHGQFLMTGIEAFVEILASLPADSDGGKFHHHIGTVYDQAHIALEFRHNGEPVTEENTKDRSQSSHRNLRCLDIYENDDSVSIYYVTTGATGWPHNQERTFRKLEDALNIIALWAVEAGPAVCVKAGKPEAPRP